MDKGYVVNVVKVFLLIIKIDMRLLDLQYPFFFDAFQKKSFIYRNTPPLKRPLHHPLYVTL